MEGDRPLLPPFEYGAKRSGCAPCITAPFMSIDVQESLRGKSNVGDIDLTPRSSPATGRAPDYRSYGGGGVLVERHDGPPWPITAFHKGFYPVPRTSVRVQPLCGPQSGDRHLQALSPPAGRF